MTNFDQSQTFRLGQLSGSDNTLVVMCDDTTIPEAPWSGMMIYRTDLQVLQVYRSVADGGSDAFEDVVSGVAAILTFIGDTPPTSVNEGDLWYDTSTNRTLYRAASVGADEITSGEWEVVQEDVTALELVSIVVDALNAADLSTMHLVVGTPGAQRVEIDGQPYIRAYDSGDNITVNIDGLVNFIAGSFATAQFAPKIVMGQGYGTDYPNTEMRFFTGHFNEILPALISGAAVGGGSDRGSLSFVAPTWDGPHSTAPPSLDLISALGGSTSNDGKATLSGDEIWLISNLGPYIVMGPTGIEISNLSSAFGVSINTTVGPITLSSPIGVDATMRNGSVGNGTFRDSVDARVAAATPAFSFFMGS